MDLVVTNVLVKDRIDHCLLATESKIGATFALCPGPHAPHLGDTSGRMLYMTK
jgi:hypothetical protein